MVIEYAYSIWYYSVVIYSVRGIYYSTAEKSAHGACMCVMVSRGRSTDVRFCERRTTLFSPFLLIFVDFHHSRHIDFFS